jgi:hypothetical protein
MTSESQLTPEPSHENTSLSRLQRSCTDSDIKEFIDFFQMLAEWDPQLNELPKVHFQLAQSQRYEGATPGYPHPHTRKRVKPKDSA